MVPDGLLLQPLLSSGQWEDALREWEKNVSLQMLGHRTAMVMQKVMPAKHGPVLKDIASAFYQQDDDLRWHIFQQVKTTGFSSPIGALALSLFWSFGSMSPRELEPVYPDPGLSPTLLHCALVTLVMTLSEDPVEGVNLLLTHYASLERM